MINDFRQFFIDNFASDIGTYEFKGVNGAFEAIAILPAGSGGYDYPPTGTVVKGVEFKTAIEQKKRKGLINDGVMKQEVRFFCLQQWTGSQNLEDIGDRLADLLVFNNYKILDEGIKRGNETLQIKPQYVINAISLNVQAFTNCP